MTVESAAQMDELKLAFDLTKSRRDAVPLSSLPAVFNLNSTYATTVVEAAIKRVHEYRSELTQMYKFNISDYDDLKPLSDSLLYIQGRIARRIERLNMLPIHVAEGVALREIFFVYGDLLTLTGAIPAGVIAKLRAGQGHQDLIEDLAALIGLFSEHPEWMLAGSPVTVAHFNRAKGLLATLRVEVGEKEDPDGTQTTLYLERRRAAFLLIAAYDEVRAAIVYLRRHEGDALTLVPALYAATGGHSAKELPSDPVVETKPATPAPAAPTAPAAPAKYTVDTDPNGPFERPRS